jgi:hypothetical protein
VLEPERCRWYQLRRCRKPPSCLPRDLRDGWIIEKLEAFTEDPIFPRLAQIIAFDQRHDVDGYISTEEGINIRRELGRKI